MGVEQAIAFAEGIEALAGGGAIVGLTLLLGTTEFNGAGMDSVARAIEQGTVRPDAFFWKLVFTALTYSLTILGVDTNLQFVFSGIIILSAVTIDCLKYVQKK